MTSDSVPVSRRYRFGPYTFDTGRGLLWREGVRIALTPKTADVLRVLVERRGDLVEKSDLMRSVWPNTFVEENNLARHVATLRTIFQERRGQHDIISTIPGRGWPDRRCLQHLACPRGSVVARMGSETRTVVQRAPGRRARSRGRRRPPARVRRPQRAHARLALPFDPRGARLSARPTR